MKTYFYLLLAICLCGCSSSPVNKEILEIDVTANHSKIELNLDEIADVEYIPLSSDSNFLTGKRMLICKDRYMLTYGENDKILIFSRQGKAMKEFSHWGNGPHEYNYITNLLADEKKQEIYVHDCFLRKFFVYDLNGKFLREYPGGDARFVYDFDDETFLVYNTETNRVDPDLKPYFSLVSKKDGAILKKIEVPFALDKRIDLAVTKDISGGSFTYTSMHLPLSRNADGFFLNELSSDTIYKFSFEQELKPYIVRKPSVASMSQPVFLQCGIETSKYIFMTRVAINERDKQNMFPETNWVYNKKDGSISEYEIVNKDFLDSKMALTSHHVNCSTKPGYGMFRYRSYELVEAYQEWKLFGKLKDIAATLDEEDNDVIVVCKFK